MSDRYWSTIELSPKETKKYSRIDAKLWAKDPEDPNYFAKILSSDKYSFDFKKKLVFHYPARKVARKWGANNLRSQDLCELVDLFTSAYILQPTEEDLDNLLENPTFIHTVGEKYDPLIRTLVSLKMNIINDGLVSRLVELIVQKKQMTADIAELVIAVNQNEVFKNRQHITMLPIVNWARELYDFDESVPDSWVINFLEEESKL